MSEPVIVIDNGSGYIKSGLSNKDKPSIMIPNWIGHTYDGFTENIGNIKLKKIMIGEETTPVKFLLKLTYPMIDGSIINEEDMSIIWDYCIKKKLGIYSNYKNRKILLTESPCNSMDNKKKMAEILFEKLEFGYFNVEPQAKASLFAGGETTGIVLDSGEDATYIVPIFEGSLMQNHIKNLKIGGRDITEYLIKLLQFKGYSLNSSFDFESVREMKEKHCFVSIDIDSDRRLERETTYYNSFYNLPDNRKIRISQEKFEAPEILFNSYDGEGINGLLYDSIKECDFELRKNFFQNIVLSGANTMFPGLSSRIEIEMNKKIYYYKKVYNIFANVDDNFIRQNRIISAFIGACLIANTYNDSFQNNYWFSKKEWEEEGTKIIYKKCPN